VNACAEVIKQGSELIIAVCHCATS